MRTAWTDPTDLARSMWELIKDFAGFMAQRKKYWMLPIIVVMMLLGVLIVVAKGSAIAPFIYTIF